MDKPADYDTDILLWSEAQGRILRDLATRVRDLPNELDLENVAEEIESVGRSEFREAQRFLELVFEHIIKSAAMPDGAEPQMHWFGEARQFFHRFNDALTASMVHRIDVQRLWKRASLEAKVAFGKQGRTLPAVPKTCPFRLDEFRGDDFDFDAAVRILRDLFGEEPGE